MELLRILGPAVAALAATLLFDHMTRRRGLDPPGFRDPARRFASLGLVAFCFYLGIFAALGTVGRQAEVDLSQLASWQLFTLHALFVLTLVGWWFSGFFRPAPVPAIVHEILPVVVREESAGLDSPPTTAVALAPAARPTSGWRSFAEQLGLRTPAVGREVAVGVAAGFGAWLAVLAAVFVFALVLAALSGDDLLPKAPPAIIPWIAARPLLLRFGIAASAGLVEEAFFRGFLQPRIGIGLSTLFFALAHLSYDQPIMLVGVTLLSLLYGGLTRWRQNIWPAVVAHFLFDAIQLVVVIPAVLELWKPGAP